jgi:hypothetical protein
LFCIFIVSGKIVGVIQVSQQLKSLGMKFTVFFFFFFFFFKELVNVIFLDFCLGPSMNKPRVRFRQSLTHAIDINNTQWTELIHVRPRTMFGGWFIFSLLQCKHIVVLKSVFFSPDNTYILHNLCTRLYHGTNVLIFNE